MTDKGREPIEGTKAALATLIWWHQLIELIELAPADLESRIAAHIARHGKEDL